MPEHPRDVQITETDRRQVSGDGLAAEIGLDREEIAFRKSFTKFDADDERRLREMAPVFEEVSEPLVEEFYANILRHDETEAILSRSTKSVEMLKRSQTTYLTDLGRGQYDREYFEKRARIGKIHDMLDLGPKVYLGAYGVYFEGILEGIAESVKRDLDRPATPESNGADGLDPEAAIDRVVGRALSVFRLINLDQQVAMDTYIHSYASRLEDELERQHRVSADVQQTVEDLQEMSTDVAESSQEIADIAAAQSRQTRDAADEAANMSATIEEVASAAQQVETTSETAAELAEDGQASATEAVSVMEDVSESARTVETDVSRLQNRVGEIDEVIEVINDIADQTDLLALNANIEAARVGEAGEGFAVVAEEVKSLAEESQQRVSEVESMIRDIQDDAEETVDSLEHTNDQITRGITQVEDAMQNLTEIVDAVKEAAAGIEEVSTATAQQAESTTEITEMVEEVSERADDVQAEIDDISAANQEQAARVDEISHSVGRLTDGGTDGV